ncbi:MAG: hypothetical protein GY801_18535 [bacterium]|nr:hypothetical protein [bacterium]
MSQQRFVKCLGTVDEMTIRRIENALKRILDIE